MGSKCDYNWHFKNMNIKGGKAYIWEQTTEMVESFTKVCVVRMEKWWVLMIQKDLKPTWILEMRNIKRNYSTVLATQTLEEKALLQPL